MEVFMSGNGKGWANPAPAGLVALAIACFTFFSIFNGKVDHSALPLLGCWLVGGFVVQIIVGVIELLEGNQVGGNVFTFFAAFFMLTTAIECFYKFWAAKNGLKLDGRIDGWAWICLSTTLVLWTPAYMKSVLVMSSLVISLDIAVWIVTFMDLGMIARAEWAPIAGWFLLIGGILGLYMASAVILNGAFGKVLLPTGPAILK
jgi:uncharacterized protein